MNPENRQKIQIVMAVAIAIAAARTSYILYERHAANVVPPHKEEVYADADLYVRPRGLHAYDLKSMRELIKMPVWVRTGYLVSYYPYNVESHRADFSHEAGLLGPIEKLQVRDVVLETAPAVPGQKQIMSVFEKDGKDYAFSVGYSLVDEFHPVTDDLLFIDDPHVLYKHWKQEVWDAIEKHEVRPGMNELQTSFAIGVGLMLGSGDNYERTLKYPNGGKPLTVTFRAGKAVEIVPMKE